MSEGIRPEKVLSERPAAAPAVPGNQGDAGGEGAAQIESHAVSAPEAVSDLAPAASPASTTARSLRPIPNGTSADLPPPPSHAAESGRREAHGQELLTAIYKPASKAAWKEALRSANEKAEQVRGAAACAGAGRVADADLNRWAVPSRSREWASSWVSALHGAVRQAHF